MVRTGKIAAASFSSGQSADRALANLCERLVFVTPDLLRKSTPEGFVDKISGKRK